LEDNSICRLYHVKILKDIIKFRLNMEIDIPDTAEVKISRLIKQGEFSTKEEAIEDIILAGIKAYNVNETDKDMEGDYNMEEYGEYGDEDYVF
jgi:hypothetical protein